VSLHGFARSFVQTNLVSDIAGLATITDSSLVNPWGFRVPPRALLDLGSRDHLTNSLVGDRPYDCDQMTAVNPPTAISRSRH